MSAREEPHLSIGHDLAPPKPEAAKEKRLRDRRVRRLRRQGWRSPLTRRILAVNILVLAIPVFGLLHLDQYRESLIEAELDAMRTQARTYALSIGSTAVGGDNFSEERLVPDIVRNLLRVLLADTELRARVFARDGSLISDTAFSLGSGLSTAVEVENLPPPEEPGPLVVMENLYEDFVNWLPGGENLPVYFESFEQRADHYWEVVQALNGQTPGTVRRQTNGRLIMTIAVPVQRYRQVLGAFLLSKDGEGVREAVKNRRADILLVFALALSVTIFLSIYLASTIARPIRRLADAADQVRYGANREYQLPDFSRRKDEIGDLSEALRDMTQALWSRLDAIEGFAADVAHEIKNPLSSLRSAVETVSRIEDPDQQRKLIAIILDDVSRLNRLITDISDASRLDAELSRAHMEPVDIAQILETLVEIQKAGAREGGPRFELTIKGDQRLVVPGLEGRLGQVLRNLITNAITFSPPEGLIHLTGQRVQGGVEVTIADQGPGIPDGKLEAIFNRFYTERPKSEKFGTHSGLGLSISKQIVDAHGGSITAENRVNAEGVVIGALFRLYLPEEIGA